MPQAVHRAAQRAAFEADAYSQGEDRPLAGYATTMGVFATLVAGGAGIAAATGRRVPSDLGTRELLLLAAGTHKLSRILSKSAVASPLRASFTEYAGSGGPGEVMEEVRSGGELRHSVGELLACPFCLDVWAATGFAFGFVFAPRGTKFVLGVLTALTGADYLHLAYAAAQRAAG